MSRIGKQIITVPKTVKVTVDGNQVTVKGPKGELKRNVHPSMIISMKDSTIAVERPSDAREHRQLHGLTRTLIANMIKGVTDGFEVVMDIAGVGYKAQKAGDKTSIQVGHTHPEEAIPPTGVAIQLVTPTRLKISGIDKEVIGQVAAKLKAIRPPDAYKGKGIRYAGELVRKKAGKAGKAAGKK